LKEGVIEEKEKQIMFELMEKYNVGGHQPARDDDNRSRTSSDILFGEKVSNKRREAKAADKDDRMSVVSGKTSKSKNYHKMIECDLCKKPVRRDNIKRHRGGLQCTAK
jgi:hypothetical protein